MLGELPLPDHAATMLTAVLIGLVVGLVWGLITTEARRRHFLRAGVPPVGQGMWFLLNWFAMSSFVAFVLMLGLAATDDLIPRVVFWFLLLTATAAFCAALCFSNLDQPQLPRPRRSARHPVIDPDHPLDWQPADADPDATRDDQMSASGPARA